MSKKLIAGAVGILGGLVAATTAQANVEYQCQSVQGVRIEATLFDEEDVVVARFIGSDGLASEVLLQPAVSGSGFRYAGQGTEFRGRGDQATLDNGAVSVSCFVTAVTAPGDPQPGGGGFGGFSFGGNLRAGPGTNFARVGGLAEGTPVTLLQDSGAFFNGYSFWLIQTPNGQQAYHWGGILCAPGQFLTGIFNDGC